MTQERPVRPDPDEQRSHPNQRTEDALRSAAPFRLLVENVADYAIYMLDLGGRVTSWNRGAERMKGYAADEIIGKHFSLFFPAEDVASGKPERELDAARAEGRYEDEGWRVRKDGTRFWANALMTALRDETGTLLGYAKITRDLSARRQAEETERRLVLERAAREAAEMAESRLRESEQRYRSLSQRLEIVLEGVADGITVQDRSGRVVFANLAAAKICGFDTAEELVAANPADVVARFEMLDDKGNTFSVDSLPGRRVLGGERVAEAVMQVRHKKSRRAWWTLIRASAVQALDGSHELAINIWHDISAQRRQEQQSRFLADASAALGSSLEGEQMLAALAGVLIPGLGDWCSIHVLDGRDLRNVVVAHTEPARVELAKDYQRRFKPDRARAAGVWNVLRTGKSEVYNDITDDLLVSSAADASHLDALRAIGMKAVLVVPISTGARALGVLSLVYAESDRRYEAADVALGEELGRRAGVALENARHYAAAKAAVKAAEEASRAKDEFLATVSHELRTPLNAILGWSAILKDRVIDPAVAKPIAVIHRNADAQIKIIDDILDVSRLVTGKLRVEPRPTDLVQISRDALESVRASAAAKNVDLELAAEADFMLVVVDPERMQQVIWNLLSNAVKFTDGGGRVRLVLRQERSEVQISVEDTGKGIDPTFLPFVFERFRQADSSTTRRVGGLGLGLALVRHIAELHGGRVEAESAGVGKGSVFRVTVPLPPFAPAAVERQRTGAAPSSADLSGLVGLRVLVVDDEEDARELLFLVLEQAGAIVEAAASAASGFEAFQNFRPQVLVSDIAMPGEDGLAFIRRIRALPIADGGRVPALALSALAREEDRTRALSAGFTTYIGKPVDPEALASAVANLAAIAIPP